MVYHEDHQVNGRNAISWEEKFELDVGILWMTVVDGDPDFAGGVRGGSGGGAAIAGVTTTCLRSRKPIIIL